MMGSLGFVMKNMKIILADLNFSGLKLKTSFQQ